jgi:hypothetical protein
LGDLLREIARILVRPNIVFPGTPNTVEIRRWHVDQRVGPDSGGTRREMVITAVFDKERIGVDGIGRRLSFMKAVVVVGVEIHEVVRVDVVNPRVPFFVDSIGITR